jgi:GNAT superfamily N-acetyltransferase
LLDMDFSLAPASSEDEPFLAALFNDVRAVEFAPLGLPASALEQLLTMQMQAQRMGYASQFPHAEDKIIWLGQERAGRMLVDRTSAEIRLVDVALLARYRSNGVGGRLLGSLCEEARAKQLPLRLSVRFGNPAERLYERLGFMRTGGDGINIDMELLPQVQQEAARAAEPVTAKETEFVEQGDSAMYFRTLLGQTLVARSQDGVTADLVLESIVALDRHKRQPGIEIGDSFVLAFRGPLSPVLPSATVELTPPSAEPMAIFIVPLGPQDGAMQYEAIFNRVGA